METQGLTKLRVILNPMFFTIMALLYAYIKDAYIQAGARTPNFLEYTALIGANSLSPPTPRALWIAAAATKAHAGSSCAWCRRADHAVGCAVPAGGVGAAEPRHGGAAARDALQAASGRARRHPVVLLRNLLPRVRTAQSSHPELILSLDFELGFCALILSSHLEVSS